MKLKVLELLKSLNGLKLKEFWEMKRLNREIEGNHTAEIIEATETKSIAGNKITEKHEIESVAVFEKVQGMETENVAAAEIPKPNEIESVFTAEIVEKTATEGNLITETIEGIEAEDEIAEKNDIESVRVEKNH
jgi:hypothetical protein